MIDGLKKKEQALLEILSITENQQTVLQSDLPLDEARTIIFSMNEGKQEAIQIVKNCDNMLEKMLGEIGQELDAKQHMYKPQVQVMQEHIRRIMDLDVKVRVGEEQNNKLLDERRNAAFAQQGLKPKPSPIIADSNRIIKAYEQGQRHKG